MNPQRAQMRHGGEAFDERAKARVLQHQRIATGENDLVHVGIALQCVDDQLAAGVINTMLGVREFAAKAVTAVHGANRGRDQQRAALIFPQQTRYRREVRLL